MEQGDVEVGTRWGDRSRRSDVRSLHPGTWIDTASGKRPAWAPIRRSGEAAVGQRYSPTVGRAVSRTCTESTHSIAAITGELTKHGKVTEGDSVFPRGLSFRCEGACVPNRIAAVPNW